MTHQRAGAPSDLGHAVELADLPAMVLEKFPDAGAHRSCFRRADRVRLLAVWRRETSPSVDLARRDGRWVWVDRGDANRGGDAFDFLTGPAGLTRPGARRELLEREGLTGRPGRARRRPYVRPVDPLATLEPPDLPAELLDWAAAYRRLPNEPMWPQFAPCLEPHGDRCLGLLAGWIADSLRPLTVAGGPLAAPARRGLKARRRERFRGLP